MKKITFVLLLIPFSLFSQVGIGTSNPNAAAALDISSTTSGVLLPRMTETQRDAISSPPQGLLIYCTNCGSSGELQIFNGFSYTNMIGGDTQPNLAVGTNYQGGYIAYLFQVGDVGYIEGEKHGIIASTSDLSNGIRWGNTNDGASTTYDCINSHNGSPYALPCAIGSGSSNTTLITSLNGAGSYAAKICEDYTITVNGVSYDDWFLPSKDEMSELINSASSIGGLHWNTTVANYEWAPENYYWTSTGDVFQDRATTARSSAPNAGYNNRNFRGELCSVRAVRYF